MAEFIPVPVELNLTRCETGYRDLGNDYRDSGILRRKNGAKTGMTNGGGAGSKSTGSETGMTKCEDRRNV